MKYTKEILEPLVKTSLSVAEVIRKLGRKNLNGGTHAHISRRIKQFGIDVSHFLGQGRNKGTISPARVNWRDVLTNNRLGVKEHTAVLRRCMVESGIPYVCGTCGLGPVWNNKEIVLQISHKDGDSINNERSNLHFECPNCHSQTDDYAGKSACKKSNARLVEQQTRYV